MKRWSMIHTLCAGAAAAVLTAAPLTASAMPRTVTATGEYTMGEAETLHVARERALEDARRNAAEQVGIYVTSASTVENQMLTHDTVTTMTAAFLKLVGSPTYTTIAHEGTLAITVRATITAEADDSDMQKVRDMTHEPSRVAAYQQITSSYQRLQQEAALLQKQLKLAKTEVEKKEITEAIHRNEAAYQSYMLLQRAYAEPEKQAEFLDRAIELYASNVPAYAARAAHRLGTNDLAGVLQDTGAGLKALAGNADYTEDQTHMMQFLLESMQGSAHFLQGDNDGAVAAFQKADHDADLFDIQLVRPDIYSHFLFDFSGIELLREDYASAEKHYTKLIAFLDKLPAPPEENEQPPTPSQPNAPAPAKPDGQTAAPATPSANGQPPRPSRRQERLLLRANAYAYRSIVRMQLKDAAGALSDAAELRKILPLLSDQEKPGMEGLLKLIPAEQPPAPAPNDTAKQPQQAQQTQQTQPAQQQKPSAAAAK